jgi:hypothetical protein
MKFHYRENVIVVGGFYFGVELSISGVRKRLFQEREYRLAINPDHIVWIKESLLEKR